MPRQCGDLQPPGFCDASLSAYAAVVYLVVQTDVSRFVKFVTSKMRVAPIQGQTVLRLELLSALFLARLVSRISDCLVPQLLLGPTKLYMDSKFGYRVTRSESSSSRIGSLLYTSSK